MKALVGFLVLLSSTYAMAAVDLSGVNVRRVKISHTKQSQYQTIQFSLDVKNNGNQNFNGSFTIKPLLVSYDAAIVSSHTQTGISLDNMRVNNLSIPAGESKRISYSTTLPVMRKATYGMTVFIDTRDDVDESDELNNMTNLVDLGSFEVLTAPQNNGEINIVSAVGGDLTPRLGGVSETLRTIIYGDQYYYPGEGGDDSDLWARFLLIDLNSKQVFTAPYVRYGGMPVNTCRGYEVDKQWFAIAYSDEYDLDGNPIYVDYYHQAPCFEDLVPGNYLYATLINSRDYIKESNIYDNLSVLPFTIDAVGTNVEQKELWMTHIGDAGDVSAEFEFFSNYAKPSQWQASLVGDLQNLSIDQTQGNFNSSHYMATTNLTWHASAKRSYQEGSLRVALSTLSGHDVEIPVKLFHYASASEAPSVTVGTIPTIIRLNVPKVEIVSVDISNSGQSVLEWKNISSYSWMKPLQTSGSLLPGESTTLRFEVDQSRMDWEYGVDVVLMNNSANNNKTIRFPVSWP